MLLLSKKHIRQAVTMRELIEANKTAFSMLSARKIEVPLRTSIRSQNGGAFLFMPSYASELGAAAVKIVGFFPENVSRGLLTNPGQVLLIDGETGYIQAVLDGGTVTQLRTGAASGAAFDLLAKKDCVKGALIGTGGQAAAQLEAMLTVRPLKEVCVFSRSRENCRAFTERMQAELSRFPTEIRTADSAEDCVRDADLIITVTTSETPVFDGAFVKEGATVSCVGTFEPHKHELDPSVLLRASKIYCDSAQAVLQESGDLLIPISQGLLSEADITGDLGDVLNGTAEGRTNDREIIVFETVGTAAQDLTAAKIIYENAVRMQIGIPFEA